jgi:hypothetical protein
MNKTGPPIRGQIHRGTFADGEASPDLYPDDDRVGGLAGGQADPTAYADDDHVGSFAEGEADPAVYRADLEEGRFDGEAVRPTD